MLCPYVKNKCTCNIHTHLSIRYSVSNCACRICANASPNPAAASAMAARYSALHTENRLPPCVSQTSTMMQHKIYAYISDGAVEEEISQGVGRIAGNLGLNNLIMFYDSNDIQLSTECGVVMNYPAKDSNIILVV